MQRINCTTIAANISRGLSNLIRDLPVKHEIKIVILYTHDNSATKLYISNKQKKAAALGIKTETILVEENLLEEVIAKFNADISCHGIIVQLPLLKTNPLHIAQLIDPKKDIDGLNPINVGLLSYGEIEGGFVPCTALGCLAVLQHYYAADNENGQMNILTNNSRQMLSGKSVVIVGRSNIVGKPLSALLTKYNATVTLAHSCTLDLANLTSKADIVVLATGAPRYFGQQYFNTNSMVLDVGINKINGQLCGDADIDHLTVQAITPVPGGIGPMTVVCLMYNAIKAYKMTTRDHMPSIENMFNTYQS